MAARGESGRFADGDKLWALCDNPRAANRRVVVEDEPEEGGIQMKEVIETLITPEVSTGQPADTAKFSFSRILAPTDFSPNSDRAVDYALQLARRLGAKLTLLHIVPEASALSYTMGGISTEEIEEWLTEAEKRLAEQLARAKVEYQEVDSVRRTALHTRDEIVNVATELPADLLVISTHGYTGWKHFLFGSDAEKIIEHAPCPILVVR
jgi:universal stress protein A